MPFEETHVVDERTRFIEDVHRSLKSFTAICERYGISRTTGYKWLARWKAHGPPGLVKSRVVSKSERKLLDASVRLPWRPPWVREA